MKLKRFFSPEGLDAGGGDPAPDAATGGDVETPAAEPTPAPERPDGLAEEFFDAESGVKLGELIQSHNALSEAARERLADRPEEASAYEFTVPDAYENPEEIQELLAGDAPFMEAARKFLFDAGASQDQAAELFNLYLADRIGSPEQLQEGAAAEMGQLGDNADARVDAVSNWLKANVGEELYGAVKPLITTAASVKAMEKLMEANKDKPLPNNGDGGSKEAKQVDPLDRAVKALFPKTAKKG